MLALLAIARNLLFPSISFSTTAKKSPVAAPRSAEIHLLSSIVD